MAFFLKKIKIITKDRQHGSTWLLHRLLEVLEQAQPGPGELRQAFRELRQLDPAMVVVHHLIRFLESGLERASLPVLLEQYRQQWQDTDQAIARHLAAHLPAGKPASFLLHSHSHTLIGVLGHLALLLPVTDLWQTRSLPGGEGDLQAAALQQYGLPVQLIADEEAATLMPQITACLLGADQYNNRAFINKKGTASLVQAALDYQKPVFILADSRKQVSHLAHRQMNRQLFEVVNWQKNTYLVNEKRLYRPAVNE